MKIAILDDYQGVALDMADWGSLPAGAEITVFRDTITGHDALAERLAPFAIICAMRERTPFPASLINALPDLKLIITAGMKNASINVAAANARGVLVCGTGAPGHATAELAFAMMLNLRRGLIGEHVSMRTGGWQVGLGRDLNGATLGIIGFGKLGQRITSYARVFGMEVIAWSASLTAEAAAEHGATRVEKDALFRRADIVTIHTRLSDRTQGLVGAAEIGLMKPTAYLINTSRAPIVDMAALTAACREGRIAGAGIDVYDVEPQPADAAIREIPSILSTPHIGYVTEETYRVFYGGMVEAAAAFMRGTPVKVIAP